MANLYRDRIQRGAAGAGILFISLLFISPVWAKDLEPSSSQLLARLIYTGHFDQAKKVLSTQPAGVVNRPTDPLATQLNTYSQLSDQREKTRLDNYNENVKSAHDYLAKATAVTTTTSVPATKPVKSKRTVGAKPGLTPHGAKKILPVADSESAPKSTIEKALTEARKAKYYALDAKQFGQLPWVLQIAASAKKQAQVYLDRHEWLRAGNIYAELATIYEDDTTYDKLTRDCAMRVRFEATYNAKADWNEQIKNIKVDVIPELSNYIANFYVEKPDFGKMMTTGLQSIAMVSEIPKLIKVFPVLKDSKKTQAFDTQIRKLMEQVKSEMASKSYSSRDFWQAFIKLLVINDDTIGLPQEMVIREFTDCALGELDPFTNLIWPAEIDDFDKHTTGRFSGVGIQLSMENNKLKVITPIPGTPAYHAGIIPGDVITTINGESTEGITIDQAVRKITGPKGTKVTLGIQHPWTERARQVPMTRDTIIIQTIKGYRMDKDNAWQYLMDPPNEKIAYVRITSFTETTVSELQEALDRIRKQGARGLILDLRFNPGGTLKAAVEVVEQFISKGVIVSTKGRSVDPWERRAGPDGKFTDLPMVVLINGFSASAAEIVSGALKDYHRAWLVGERSFGKGSVQNVLELPSGAYRLKITTAYYYLPKGKCIHKKPDSKEWGVDPNLKIELTPNELRDIIDLQREAEIVKQVNGMKVSTIPTSASKPTTTASSVSSDEEDEEEDVGAGKLPTTRKFPPQDIQLQAAAAILQARLVLNIPWDNVAPKESAADSIMVKTK